VKTFLKIIIHIGILYGIYWIGTWIERIFHLPVPGSVIGMILLFLLLQTNIIKLSWIREGTDFFIKHLTLFFIPATVGIINYLELFIGKGFLLVVITIISTVLVMAGSGLISQWLIRRKEWKHD